MPSDVSPTDYAPLACLQGEAALLFGTVPLLSLGHLTQLMPREGEQVLLAIILATFAVFAARKYTQVCCGACSAAASPLDVWNTTHAVQM